MLKRLLFFAYGAACYLIFLATLLYAIAFVGGLAVPTRLDDDRQSSLAIALMIDCALLALFAIQHSVMARRWFKERWTQVVPWVIERSTYVLCASLALLLLFWQWRPIGIQIWSVENGVARAALWMLFAAGWATVLAVTFLINHFDLFGLRQVWLPLVGRPYTRVSFRTPLPYRFVRHPLYFGFLLAFWMTPTMTLAHLVFALATTVYIVLAIQFEERDLIAEHGTAYEEYRRSVPMLVPGTRAIGNAARTFDHACGNGRRESRVAAPPTKEIPEEVCMTIKSFGRRFGSSVLGVLVLVSTWSSPVLAQHDHTTAVAAKNQSSELVRIVREATERFKDPAVTDGEDYKLAFGCVSGPDYGAMGLHFVNMSLVGDPELDPRRPEIVIYEPLPNGRLRLVGADFLVLASAWDALHPGQPPQIMGQLLHLFEAPNRFGLPAFYTLHVWAWKENPTGTFVNWHANVSCDSFSGQ